MNTTSPEHLPTPETGIRYESEVPPVSFEEAIANLKYPTQPHTFTEKKWKNIKARRRLANASKKQNRHNGK